MVGARAGVRGSSSQPATHQHQKNHKTLHAHRNRTPLTKFDWVNPLAIVSSVVESEQHACSYIGAPTRTASFIPRSAGNNGGWCSQIKCTDTELRNRNSEANRILWVMVIESMTSSAVNLKLEIDFSIN